MELVRWEGGKGVAAAASSCRAKYKGCSMGWYLPVQVVEEKELSGSGVEVVVQIMRWRGW